MLPPGTWPPADLLSSADVLLGTMGRLLTARRSVRREPRPAQNAGPCAVARGWESSDRAGSITVMGLNIAHNLRSVNTIVDDVGVVAEEIGARIIPRWHSGKGCGGCRQCHGFM